MKNIFKAIKYAAFAVCLASSVFQTQAIERDLENIIDYLDTVKAQARFLNTKIDDLKESAGNALGISGKTVGQITKAFAIPVMVDRYFPGIDNLSRGKAFMATIVLGGLGHLAYSIASNVAADLISKRPKLTRAEAVYMAQEAKEMLADANEVLGDLER